MCGRFALGCALDALLPHLQGPMPPGLAEHYAPRSLIRPGEPVLLQRQEHGAMESALVLWGLLPAVRPSKSSGLPYSTTRRTGPRAMGTHHPKKALTAALTPAFYA